jgi:hypothetical protein
MAVEKSDGIARAAEVRWVMTGREADVWRSLKKIRPTQNSAYWAYTSTELLSRIWVTLTLS